MVDDEQDLTFTLKATLEETGSFQVETFTDPVLALSEFKAGVYDLAALNIRMPKMKGFQLCRKLRDVDNRLKICFLTATELLYYQETDEDLIMEPWYAFVPPQRNLSHTSILYYYHILQHCII